MMGDSDPSSFYSTAIIGTIRPFLKKRKAPAQKEGRRYRGNSYFVSTFFSSFTISEIEAAIEPSLLRSEGMMIFVA